MFFNNAYYFQIMEQEVDLLDNPELLAMLNRLVEEAVKTIPEYNFTADPKFKDHFINMVFSYYFTRLCDNMQNVKQNGLCAFEEGCNKSLNNDMLAMFRDAIWP